MSGAAPVAEGVLAGHVSHQRLRPLRHRLRYGLYTLLLDLDRLPATCARLRWLSLNRFNLLAVHERDHGDGRPRGLVDWVRERLREAGLPADGPVRMLAMPRVLGHVFNPLSLYFCHDAAGHLRAVLYEVHNTFGERHGYLVEVPPGTDAAAVLQQQARKDFHVSPFLDMDLRYHFRLAPACPAAGRFDLSIAVHDARGPVLVAHEQLQHAPLTDAALLRQFIRHPLLTLKVVAGIHWEALTLWRRGVGVRHKPDATPLPITVLKAGG